MWSPALLQFLHSTSGATLQSFRVCSVLPQRLHFPLKNISAFSFFGDALLERRFLAWFLFVAWLGFFVTLRALSPYILSIVSCMGCSCSCAAVQAAEFSSSSRASWWAALCRKSHWPGTCCTTCLVERQNPGIWWRWMSQLALSLGLIGALGRLCSIWSLHSSHGASCPPRRLGECPRCLLPAQHPASVLLAAWWLHRYFGRYITDLVDCAMYHTHEWVQYKE